MAARSNTTPTRKLPAALADADAERWAYISVRLHRAMELVMAEAREQGHDTLTRMADESAVRFLAQCDRMLPAPTDRLDGDADEDGKG